MANKPNKTQVTEVSVDDFLNGLEPETRRADARRLCEIMGRVSREPPKMWGPSIVGFGSRHYRYDSGREGDILKVGFAPRASAFALYVTGEVEGDPLVARLGKFTHGKSCINVKRLTDIDLGVLESLIARRFN